MKIRILPRAGRRVLLAAGALAAIAGAAGCIIPAAIGGMAQSYRMTGTSKVWAEYTGLQGKTYAVVTLADRAIEAEHPGLVARVTQRVNDRLRAHAGATGHIPSDTILAYTYNNPHWQAMPRGELAAKLKVDRLIIIELLEYRLNEPGNDIVWDGTAAATVSVVEGESGVLDEPIFEKAINVTFPDVMGLTYNEIPQAAVTTELSNRLIDRIAWTFYDHEEPNMIKY